ncbi:abortive infection family protein [Methylobacterium sp. SI9]|uniref:abortive infection family protein n=1 Tax=Methylobacterium guangdongense TaxID=3138811 RepID=UPI00313CEFDD
MKFQDLFATPDEVLRLSPEQLGVGMLPLLVELSGESGLDPGELQARIAGNTPNVLSLAEYPPSRREEVRNAVMRAWQWLCREWLVVEAPPGVGGFRWRLSEDAIALAGARDPLTAVKNGRIQVLSRPGAIISELSVKSEHLGFDTVQRDIARAMLSLAEDPEDAVTAGCSMIESVCRSILTELGIPLPDKRDIDGLARAVQAPLGLSPGQKNIPAEVERDVRQILGGITSVAKGVGALRTHAGDAHGREAGYPSLDVPTARFAINAAASLALFLIETWELRQKRDLPDRGDPDNLTLA